MLLPIHALHSIHLCKTRRINDITKDLSEIIWVMVKTYFHPFMLNAFSEKYTVCTWTCRWNYTYQDILSTRSKSNSMRMKFKQATANYFIVIVAKRLCWNFIYCYSVPLVVYGISKGGRRHTACTIVSWPIYIMAIRMYLLENRRLCGVFTKRCHCALCVAVIIKSCGTPWVLFIEKDIFLCFQLYSLCFLTELQICLR